MTEERHIPAKETSLALLKDELDRFKPPVDEYTGKPLWVYSSDLESRMAVLYEHFSSSLQAIPEAVPSLPQGTKDTIQVELIETGNQESRIVPTYTLPDGTKIKFSAEPDYLRPIITKPGEIIPKGYDDKTNFEHMKQIVNALEKNPQWRLGAPSLQLGDYDKTVILREAAKNNLIHIPQEAKIETAISNIPPSVRKYLPPNDSIRQEFYPEKEELLSIGSNYTKANDLANISLVRIAPSDRESVGVLPTQHKDYCVRVTLKRQTDEITIPLQYEGQNTFATLAKIMQQDEEGLTIQVSPEFYDTYRKRVSEEVETVLLFLSNSLDLDRSIRTKARELLRKIRLIRLADLQIYGAHFLRPEEGINYAVDDQARQTATVDLGFVKEVSELFDSHLVLQSLMLAEQNAPAVRVTDYLGDIVSIMTDLSKGKVPEKVKDLLRGKTSTGNLPEEAIEQMNIIDFGGGLIQPSYREVSAEIARAVLELTIDVSGDKPQYTLKVGKTIRTEDASQQAEARGLGPVTQAIIDNQIAILRDGKMAILPKGGCYLNPKTGIVVFSEQSLKKNREEDLAITRKEIANFNPHLSVEDREKAAENIVNHVYKTVTVDPQRSLNLLQEIIRLKEGETSGTYKEVDITELVAAFLPYHSSQEEVNEESFKLFCHLFGIDPTQVSTWCLWGKGIDFRLYQIGDDSYLGVTLFKLDPLNQNNAVAYSYVRGKDLKALISNSKQQMVEMGILNDMIKERDPTKTIGITNPREGYTLKEAIQSIFGK